jgi:hypothetical protein
VALDLCARLSTGRPWPDGSPGPGPTTAVYLSGEDASEDVTCPRLRALGADMKQVLVIKQEQGAGDPLQFPAHAAYLEAVVADVGARLVVIDPVLAFLDRTVVIASDQSIRRGLAPLKALAEKYRCAILLIRHLNKVLTSHALYRGLGAVGLGGLCRTVWLAARDPDDPTRAVLAEQKTNLAPPQPSLAFALPTGKEAPLAVSWPGEVPWTAQQLLSRRRRQAPPPPRLEQAKDFLEVCLEKGPRPARDIWAAAAEQGLSRRTLLRAKRALSVRRAQVATEGGPVWYWLLQGQEPPAPAPAQAGPPELEPWLAPLRAQYGGPGPVADTPK